MMSSSAENHRYGAAVIGRGGMRINHVAAAANHPRTDLVAVVDWKEDAREQCQRDYAAKDAYADHTVILHRDDLQLVVVATWYNVTGLMSSGAYSKGLFFGVTVRLCGSVRLTTKQLARPKCL